MKFTNVSMTDFAQTMQLMVDRPVLDQTNLRPLRFQLLWLPDPTRAAANGHRTSTLYRCPGASGIEAGGHAWTDGRVCHRCRHAANAGKITDPASARSNPTVGQLEMDKDWLLEGQGDGCGVGEGEPVGVVAVAVMVML